MHSILRRSPVYRGKSADFDESKHPRDDDGKFGSGGGSGGGSFDPAIWQERENALDKIRSVSPPPPRPTTDEEIAAVQKYTEETARFMDILIDDPLESVDEAKKESAKFSMRLVLKNATIQMHQKIRRNLSGVRVYESTEALTKKAGIQSGECGGWFEYQPGDRVGSLHIDGNFKDKPGTAREIYAHELGHVIDGVGFTYSRDDDWHNAWKDEIATDATPLSEYAKKTPQEGFAEFSRLLLTGRYKEARMEFPKCYAFWKAKGLL